MVTQVNVVLGRGHGVRIFRVGVKLIDARVLNVSSRSVAFLREIFGQNEGAHSNFDPPPPPCGRGLKVAADTYQNDALILT